MLGWRTETKSKFRELGSNIRFLLGAVVDVLLRCTKAHLHVRRCLALTDYALGRRHSLGSDKLNVKLHVELVCTWATLGLADEKTRERIGIDAVRGVGPLRMIRREVNRTAVTARTSSRLRCNH